MTANPSGPNAGPAGSTWEIPKSDPSPTGEIPHSARRLGADGRWYKQRNKPIIGPDRASAGVPCEPTDCDLLGRPFPPPHADRLRRAFSQRQHVRQDMDRIIDTATHAGELVRKGDIVYRYIDLAGLRSSLGQAFECLGRICPHALCPACQGAGCQACNGRGWVDAWTWGRPPAGSPKMPEESKPAAPAAEPSTAQ